MRESAVEKAVGNFCKEHGITFQKFTSPNNRGVPDRILFFKGKTAFLELKAPGCKPTALQERYLMQRRMDEFDAAWYDNADSAIKWVKQVFGV